MFEVRFGRGTRLLELGDWGHSDLGRPSSSDIEATRQAAKAFIARLSAVPDSEQIELASDKFGGPVGEPLPPARYPPSGHGAV